MYLATAFTWFMVGGLMAMLMRGELARPGMQFLSPEQYNQLFTMHGTIMLLFFATPLFFAFGCFAYTPLTDITNSPGAGANMWIAGLAVSGLGTILGAVNFVATIVCLRAPGMTMFRMPIFTFNTLITSLLVI